LDERKEGDALLFRPFCGVKAHMTHGFGRMLQGNIGEVATSGMPSSPEGNKKAG